MESSVQRYDPDPAAKAAAATVLASKLGADSGLKVYLGDDSALNAHSGKSNDVELTATTGLRNRKQSHSKTNSMDSVFTDHSEEVMLSPSEVEAMGMSPQHPMVVEHHPQAGMKAHDGGWIARLAALLVGEDPTQSYALICGNCHMHNGNFPHPQHLFLLSVVFICLFLKYIIWLRFLHRAGEERGFPVHHLLLPTLQCIEQVKECR